MGISPSAGDPRARCPVGGSAVLGGGRPAVRGWARWGCHRVRPGAAEHVLLGGRRRRAHLEHGGQWQRHPAGGESPGTGDLPALSWGSGGRGTPASPGLTPALRQIGCEDGSIKLFQVVPGGIQFERNLDRRKGESGRARCCGGSIPLSFWSIPAACPGEWTHLDTSLQAASSVSPGTRQTLI